MQKRADLTGMRFGRLTAQWPAGISGIHHIWLCLCECGNLKLVRAGNLRHNTKSCGCLNAELRKGNQRNRQHGQRNTTEYRAWVAMRSRCTDQNATGYERYGGVGISVCKRWEKFENFLADMG